MTGLIIAVGIFSFTCGWFVRGFFERVERPQPQPDSPRPERLVAAPADGRAPDASVVERERRAEVDTLRDEIRTLRASERRCEPNTAGREAVSDEEFSQFRDKILDAAESIEYEGEVHFDCEEFPCIAMFEADFDTRVLEKALVELYGDDVAVMTRRHTSVGPGGSRKMRFAAVVPHSLDSDALEARFEARTWQHLIDGHLEGGRAGGDER